MSGSDGSSNRLGGGSGKDTAADPWAAITTGKNLYWGSFCCLFYFICMLFTTIHIYYTVIYYIFNLTHIFLYLQYYI